MKAAKELRNKESRIKKKEKFLRLKEAKAKAGEGQGGKLSKEEVKEIMKGDKPDTADTLVVCFPSGVEAMLTLFNGTRSLTARTWKKARRSSSNQAQLKSRLDKP